MPNQIKIAINGFGRIGRIAFRNIIKENKAKVVAINDLIPVDQLAYLLKYDSVHGKFDGDIDTEDGDLIVNGNRIRITAETKPEKLEWGNLDTDVVMECTGLFKTHEKAAAHLKAGAKKVVISSSRPRQTMRPCMLWASTMKRWLPPKKSSQMPHARPTAWPFWPKWCMIIAA